MTDGDWVLFGVVITASAVSLVVSWIAARIYERAVRRGIADAFDADARKHGRGKP